MEQIATFVIIVLSFGAGYLIKDIKEETAINGLKRKVKRLNRDRSAVGSFETNKQAKNRNDASLQAQKNLLDRLRNK